jgi:integrase
MSDASSGTVTTHDLRRTFISHPMTRLGLDQVRVSKMAGHANVSVTLNVDADAFDKATHRDHLIARINRGFGTVEGVLTWARGGAARARLT